MNYGEAEFKAKIAEGMKHIINNGGPVYIHGLNGSDRTGFVCALLEALCGATYDEMRDDYMASYANYNNITKDTDSERYDKLVSQYFDNIAGYIYGTDDIEILKNSDYSFGAEKHLSGCGMTMEEISNLIDRISE
jgi:hypothetical protein